MKQIPLSKTGKVNAGKHFALVDDEDFEYLNQWNWVAAKSKKTIYAHRTEQTDLKKKTIKMHRVILKLTNSKEQGDHIDHNGLNNQRINLRNTTHSQNQMNKSPCGLSKYLGVALDSVTKKGKTYRYWRANIRVENKLIHLGQFKTEIDAAIARDIASKKYFGEFANLNFK